MRVPGNLPPALGASPSRPRSLCTSSSAVCQAGATLFLITTTRMRLPRIWPPYRCGPAAAGPAAPRRVAQRPTPRGVQGRAGGAGPLAELVGHHHRGVGAGDRAAELAQRLAEQVGLHPGVTLAHRPPARRGGPGRRRSRSPAPPALPGADQHLGDLEGLLAVLGPAQHQPFQCPRPRWRPRPGPGRARCRWSTRSRRPAGPGRSPTGRGWSCRRPRARRPR